MTLCIAVSAVSVSVFGEEADSERSKPVYGEMYYPLTDEELAEAEVYINANDRAGLYDYLNRDGRYYKKDENGDISADMFFIYFTTKYTGSYILDDDDLYDSVLAGFVYPHIYEALLTGAPRYGDINFDNKISICDIILVNKMSNGSVIPHSLLQAASADVDGSYEIDSDDVYIMMQYVVQLIDYFPAWRK